MMNIAFCINDAYAPYVAVTLKSIVENNSSIALNVYISVSYTHLTLPTIA